MVSTVLNFSESLTNFPSCVCDSLIPILRIRYSSNPRLTFFLPSHCHCISFTLLLSNTSWSSYNLSRAVFLDLVCRFLGSLSFSSFVLMSRSSLYPQGLSIFLDCRLDSVSQPLSEGVEKFRPLDLSRIANVSCRPGTFSPTCQQLCELGRL